MRGTLINSFVTIPEPKIIKNEAKSFGKDLKSATSFDIKSFDGKNNSSSSELKEFTKIIDKVLPDNKPPKKELIPIVVTTTKS